MHRLRRFAALLMGLLVLQGALLGVGTACPLQSIAPAPDAPAAGAGGVESGHERGHPGMHRTGEREAARGPASGDRSHEDGSRGPRDPMHCATAAACGVVALAAATAVLPQALDFADTRAESGEFDLPASLGAAPEPPPPRA